MKDIHLHEHGGDDGGGDPKLQSALGTASTCNNLSYVAALVDYDPSSDCWGALAFGADVQVDWEVEAVEAVEAAVGDVDLRPLGVEVYYSKT